MEALRLGKSVVRVTKIEKDASGTTTAVTVYKVKGKKRKKSSYGLRTLDKAARRLAAAQRSAADSYSARHDRSSKKKDGWATDLPLNMARATRKGLKQLKIDKLL
jgi:hypothetical protein